MPKKKRTWSVPRITHPKYPQFLLRITELKAGGPLYAVRMVDGKQKMTSLRCIRADLGRTTKEQERLARAYALDLIEEFATRGEPTSLDEPHPSTKGQPFTLVQLADGYERHGH